MPSTYFHEVSKRTPTRLWINNPTPAEAAEAISYGSISCTTNPTYTSKMLKAASAKDATLELARQAVAATHDDHEAAALLQRETTKKLLKLFEPLYEQTHGRQGLVSIQGDPFLEEGAANIVKEAMACRGLGPNFISKIPATEAGLAAIAQALRAGIPVIATEIMSVAQTHAVLKVWEQVKRSMPDCPILFVTHITGIYDECLRKNAQKDGVAIADELLTQAGRIVARKVYELVQGRDEKLILLGGGARQDRHFTGMIGADMHVTINPDMAIRLLAENPDIERRFFDPIDAAATEELSAKLPLFKKAYDENELTVKEFEAFAPVQYFRDMFVAGWQQTMTTIKNIRNNNVAVEIAHMDST